MAKTKSKSRRMDAGTALEQYQDHLAPRLDVFEQAVYLYILRHSRLVGKPRVKVELKSARHRIARGLGTRSTPLAARTCVAKLRSLAAKGCIKLSGARNGVADVRVLLPAEMPEVVRDGAGGGEADLESLDFFNCAENRRLIFRREDDRCFYCRRKLTESNATLDHVAPRSTGRDGYRNVVAACRRCNNRKGEAAAESLLRVLFREGGVSADLLADRLEALRRLEAGELKPPLR